MKLRLIAICCGLIQFLSPALSLAQELDNKGDARLEGYKTPVRLVDSGTAVTWLLFLFLGTLALAVLFKDAKRTHLD
jgi:hypothetical protein